MAGGPAGAWPGGRGSSTHSRGPEAAAPGSPVMERGDDAGDDTLEGAAPLTAEAAAPEARPAGTGCCCLGDLGQIPTRLRASFSGSPNGNSSTSSCTVSCPRVWGTSGCKEVRGLSDDSEGDTNAV